MKLELFVELDGNLINILDIKSVDNAAVEKNWYYLTGSLEITDSNGDVYISRDDKTDIIPVMYEFFSLFFSVKVAEKKMSDMPHILSSKVCSITIMYHPNVREVLFKRMNDIYLELYFLYSSGNYKHFNFEELNFYNNIKSVFKQFDKAVRVLYPTDKINMLDELEKIIDVQG